MPPALPSGSPTRRRWGDLGSPAGPGAAAGLGCSQCVSAAPSAVPPPPGWAGPAPGGPAPAWPAAGIGWRARRPLHTSLAGGGEGSQAGSWPPPPLQCLPPCAPAGIMGGPPAHAPEEAGRGRAGRAGRDRPAQTQEERQYLVCVCVALRRVEKGEMKTKTLEGERAPPQQRVWAAAGGRKMVPAVLFFRGPIPPILPLARSGVRGAAEGVCFSPAVILAHQSLWLLLQVEIKAGEGPGPWGQGAAVKVPCVCVCVWGVKCMTGLDKNKGSPLVIP